MSTAFGGTADFMTDGKEDRIRPTANQVVEMTRRLPHGVKRFLRESPVTGQPDFGAAPVVVVEWMRDYGLISTPRRGAYAGRTILSGLGQKVRDGLHKQLEGKS